MSAARVAKLLTVASALTLVSPWPLTGAPYDRGDVFVVYGGAVARIAAADSGQSLLTPKRPISLFGIDADEAGTIFVTQWNNGNLPGAVHRLDPGTGNLVQVGQSGLLREPSDVDVMSSGMLLVSDPAALNGDGALITIDPKTGEQAVRFHASGASRNVGMSALDEFDVVYFLSETIDSGVVLFRLAPEETTATALSQGGYLIGQSFLAWDRGRLFATSYFNGLGMVLSIDPMTGAQSIVSSGSELEGPQGISVHPDGCLVVLDFPFVSPPCCRRTKMLCIDPQTGEQGVISQYGYLGLGGVTVYREGLTPARATTWGSIKARYRD